ncbi:hypothetical protein EYF80_060697 [Liparis tanakae]|uniref:Uncharacterized protein n=1 Tax=Liparis tanakae TaxID=230148 RepID=A0A4Z2EL23_9TELE|nr:hypothetical protein EYF80_060697 [Liparis tanakae]
MRRVSSSAAELGQDGGSALYKHELEEDNNGHAKKSAATRAKLDSPEDGRSAVEEEEEEEEEEEVEEERRSKSKHSPPRTRLAACP